MDSLQLQTILRILPTALENANYETLKQIQDEIDKAKLRIFDPPYLEYFHEKFDVEKYKDSNPTFYDIFKGLKLDETRRIKNPRKLEKGDDVIIIFTNLSDIDTDHRYDYDPHYDDIDNNNKLRLSFDRKNSDHYHDNYLIDCKNLNEYIKEGFHESDFRGDGKIYIYK